MKKSPGFLEALNVLPADFDIDSDEIFKELEIHQRTQRPPSEELITRLNQLASKPPFCFTQKVRKNHLL
jgi:hypothetical protein